MNPVILFINIWLIMINIMLNVVDAIFASMMPSLNVIVLLVALSLSPPPSPLLQQQLINVCITILGLLFWTINNTINDYINITITINDTSPATNSTEATQMRPTIRSQVEQVLKDVGARCDMETVRSTKRLGTYHPDKGTHVKPRPISIQFSQPDIASNFLRENGATLRRHGLGVKWWRPKRQSSLWNNMRSEHVDKQISALSARLEQIATAVATCSTGSQQDFQ